MKKLASILLSAAAIVAGFAFQSCSDDDDNVVGIYPNAVVTVKTAADHPCILQLDDKVRLIPVNITTHPYGGKQVRALVSFQYADGNVPADEVTERNVKVLWMDSILTKDALRLSQAGDPALLGNAPVEIVNDWVTVAEDGYLTLRFRTNWSGVTKHSVNLVAIDDEPNVFEFRHNAFGDTYGQQADALVAFRIADLIPQESGTATITLKWNSFSGEKSTEFKIYTGNGELPTSVSTVDRSYLRMVE